MYKKQYRKNYPRRNYRKKKQPYFGQFGNDATRALKMAGKALSLINTEHKAVDADNQVSVTTTAQTILLFAPIQGTTDSTRVGDSVKITNIQARFQAQINPSATNTFLRVMLVIDHSPNGAQFSITDLLASSSTDSFRNVDYGNRFTVLMDKRMVLTSVNNPIEVFDYYKDKLQYHIEFGSNSGTITSLHKGAINLVVVSSEATNAPALDHKIRFRYIDN